MGNNTKESLSYTSDLGFTNGSAVYIYRKSLGPVHSRPFFLPCTCLISDAESKRDRPSWAIPCEFVFFLEREPLGHCVGRRRLLFGFQLAAHLGGRGSQHAMVNGKQGQLQAVTHPGLVIN